MRIGNLNLWVSVPSLLCGFAVWLYWGIITVQMLNLGFPFSKPELFTLTAIAGFTGATLWIPSTFFIRIAGAKHDLFHDRASDDSGDRLGHRIAGNLPHYLHPLATRRAVTGAGLQVPSRRKSLQEDRPARWQRAAGLRAEPVRSRKGFACGRRARIS